MKPRFREKKTKWRVKTGVWHLQTADCRQQIADCKSKDTKNLPNEGDPIKNITSCEGEKVHGSLDPATSF